MMNATSQPRRLRNEHGASNVNAAAFSASADTASAAAAICCIWRVIICTVKAKSRILHTLVELARKYHSHVDIDVFLQGI